MTCAVGITRSGAGPRVLLLPALSSISTRKELQGVQEVLAGSGYETVSVDWPGFGVGAKRAVNWTPGLYEAFLVKVLTDIAPSPSLVVAAGHAAGYVLRVASKLPDAFGHAVFVSPTWRGPVPTVLNGERPTWLGKVLRLVDIPGLGSLLYRLNVNDLSVRLMTGRHVYSQAGWLDSRAGRMRSKHAVISSRGARHASVRFVTGMLDPFESTAAFVAAAEPLKFRIMVVIGGEMPAKSRIDVLTLMRILPRPAVILPKGRLNVHEEFPAEVAQAVLAFARKLPRK